MISRFLRIIVAAGLLVCAARIVTSAEGNPEAAKITNPIAVTPESIAAGKKAYSKCASCHGINGDVIPAAPSLVNGEWTHGASDGEIFNNIKNGAGAEFNSSRRRSWR